MGEVPGYNPEQDVVPKEERKRPGGPLEGKPVQGPDGKWYNEVGEETDAPLDATMERKRPGGAYEAKPIQHVDGQWYDDEGNKIEAPPEAAE